MKKLEGSLAAKSEAGSKRAGNGARIVIVEDHGLVRTGLRTSLRSSGFDVVGEAADGIVGQAMIAELQPDVAVIDLGIPGKDGVTLTRELKAGASPPRIVVLTMREDEAVVQAALRAGADAYCVKSSPQESIVDAIRTVAAGGAYFDPRIAGVVLARFAGGEREDDSPLTPRETEILTLIAEGAGNSEIAARLFVSLGTVKTHIGEIMHKLAASDRANATAIALRSGYIC
jgi:DNA-binding NarL/FixJ family response regulator